MIVIASTISMAPPFRRETMPTQDSIVWEYLTLFPIYDQVFLWQTSPSPPTTHPSFQVLPCFTWSFVDDPFSLTQSQVDDPPWLKYYCFASPVVYGLLALESLPSVAKGGVCTWELTYPPRHSRRAAPNPHFSRLEPSDYRGSWGVRSWSDWIRYGGIPIAMGEE